MKKQILLYFLILPLLTNAQIDLTTCITKENSFGYSNWGKPVEMASADFNNDGFDDIVITGSGAYTNKYYVDVRFSDGVKFTDQINYTVASSISGSNMEVETGDVNNDGFEDFVVSLSNGINIYIGDGLGGFSAPVQKTTSSAPYDILIADINNDSLNEIITANYSSNNISIYEYLNNTWQTLNYNVGTNPTCVTSGHFDQDNILDVAIGHESGQSVIIIGYDSLGQLLTKETIIHHQNIIDLATGELNSDGYDDLVILSTDSAYVYLSSANGTHQLSNLFFAGGSPEEIHMEDLSGDGKLDMAVLDNAAYELKVCHGTGNGIFNSWEKYFTGIYYVMGKPTCLTILDKDGDSNRDLMLGIFDTEETFCFNNKGDGTYTPLHFIGYNNTKATAGDFNNDGYVDIASISGSYYEKLNICLNDSNENISRNYYYKPSSSGALYDIYSSDLDGDNIQDILLCYNNEIKFMKGIGDGSFTNTGTYPTTVSSYNMLVDDINNDGIKDIILDNAVLLGDVNGFFHASHKTNASATNTLLIDINKDSLKDCVSFEYTSSISTNYNSIIRIAYAIGNGSFSADEIFTTAVKEVSGFEQADINNDGLADLIISLTDSSALYVKTAYNGGFNQAQKLFNTTEAINNFKIIYDTLNTVKSILVREYIDNEYRYTFYEQTSHLSFYKKGYIAGYGGNYLLNDFNNDHIYDLFEYDGNSAKLSWGTSGLQQSSANIDQGDTLIYKNKTLNFTYSSSCIDSVLWLFPGGAPNNSSLENPSIQYTISGTYDVKLVTYTSGTSDTILRPNMISVRTDEAQSNCYKKISQETTLYSMSSYAKPIVTDINGDLLDDVVYYHLNAGDSLTLNILFNEGNGEFNDSVFYIGNIKMGYSRLYIMFEDVNVDLIPDLIVCNDGSTTDSLKVFLGSGNGNFHFDHFSAIPKNGTSTYYRYYKEHHFIDINNDSFKDLILTHYGTADVVHVFLNGSSGLVYDTTYSNMSTIIYTNDLNGDSYVDLVFSKNNTMTIFNGQANSKFVFSQDIPLNNEGCLLLDLDADGDVDILTKYLGKQFMLYNDGQANFTIDSIDTVSTFSSYFLKNYYSISDMNGDGKDDIIEYGGTYPREFAHIHFSYPGANFQTGIYDEYFFSTNDFYSIQTFHLDSDTIPEIILLQEDSFYIYTNCNGLAPDIIDFSANYTKSFKGENVHFTSKVDNMPDSVYWFFEGANPQFSFLRNPVARYDTVGLFEVQLWAYNQNGEDSLSKSMYIEVVEDTSSINCWLELNNFSVSGSQHYTFHDINNDSVMDLILKKSDSIELHTGSADFSFTKSQSIAYDYLGFSTTGDVVGANFNNDDWGDFCLVGSDSMVLFINDSGTWSTKSLVHNLDIYPYHMINCVMVHDLNGDNYDDIMLIKDISADTIETYINDKNGGFTYSQSIKPRHFSNILHDVTLDGQADLIIYHLDSIHIYEGNGDGSFYLHFSTSHESLYFYGLSSKTVSYSMQDINLDGYKDIISIILPYSTISYLNALGTIDSIKIFPFGGVNQHIYGNQFFGFFNDDNHLDFATRTNPNSNDNFVSLFYGENGQFNKTQHIYIDETILGLVDFNLDGRSEIIIKESSYSNVILGSCVQDTFSGIVVSENSTEIKPLQNELLIYPNPFTNSTNIDFENPEERPHQLYVYDILGNKVREINNIINSKIILKKGQLLPGVYFIDLHSNNNQMRGKVLIE